MANEEEKLIVCFTLAYRGGSILGALLTGQQRSRKLESVTVLVCSSLHTVETGLLALTRLYRA